MIAWWTGDGTTADALGMHNGTIQGTVGYTAGEVGQAFSLTGSGYVQAPLSYLGPFTVDLWVSTANSNQPRFSSVISTGNPTDYAQFFEIDLDGSGNYQLEFGTNSVIPLGPAVSGFVHLAVTYDGSTVDAYYNGALTGSISNVSSLGFETFKIGTNRDLNAPLQRYRG
jgi:hypothetical protein